MADRVPVRRVTLHAVDRPTSDATFARAAIGVPEALEGREVGSGDEVTAGGVPFMVGALEPGAPLTVDSRVEVTLLPAPLPRGERPLHDILLLLDASWSMGKPSGNETRFEAGRRAARDFLRQAGDGVRAAGVATFRRELAIHADLAPPRSVKLDDLRDEELRGRSDLAGALDAGLALLRSRGDPRNRHALLLVTDGPGGDPAKLENAAARAKRLGAPVHVLDVSGKSSGALQRLAERTGGTYANLETGRSFGAAFDALAADVEAPRRWQPPPFAADEEDGSELEFIPPATPEEPPS